MLCRYAQWRHNRVLGCLRFENSPLDLDTSIVLAALLFNLARDRRCVAREALQAGPDAYLAQDLPEQEANVAPPKISPR
jgi:hypothetical protein